MLTHRRTVSAGSTCLLSPVCFAINSLSYLLLCSPKIQSLPFLGDVSHNFSKSTGHHNLEVGAVKPYLAIIVGKFLRCLVSRTFSPNLSVGTSGCRNSPESRRSGSNTLSSGNSRTIKGSLGIYKAVDSRKI